MAMPRLDGVRWLTTWPSNNISPEVMSSSPEISRKRVDLPHPEGPTNTMNSPFLTSRSTPLITLTAPKDLRTLRSSIEAIWPSPLTLDAAGGQAADDLALEDEHQHDKRNGHDDRGRHDDAPGNFIL